MLVRLRKLQDQIRSSLFLVPMLFVFGAIVLGEAMIELDDAIGDVPTRLTATVDSARNVLSVVAGATLSFAGIAFSVSLLLISLASSQYSPRVVHGLFRDPFNKRIMGVVIGTFTYCLVVMRAVRGPLEEGGNPVVPSISILLAVTLGIVSVLAIVAFISHSAHSMDVSKILHRVTDEALEQVRTTWLAPDGDQPDPPEPRDRPDSDGFAVTFGCHGWIQQVDHDALLGLLESNGRMELATVPGRYAIPGTALLTIWPRPGDEKAAIEVARDAVLVGETRTMQQDITYGIRQLADVALKALSPGINDPTTAQDAIFHLGSVLQELLVRSAPMRSITGDGNRLLLLPELATHSELVGMAFDEIRIAAHGQPTVQIYLLELLHLITTSLDADARAEAVDAIREQAALVVDAGALTELTDSDLQRVRRAHGNRFGN